MPIVVRQELAREHGLVVSLRTVERAVASLRQALQAEARATVRFETPPGRQLQIDFGETPGGDRRRGGAALSVRGDAGLLATLLRAGLSPRAAVGLVRRRRRRLRALRARSPQEVLLDNARALVDHHDAATREVRFNARFQAFARYWGFKPRACAPYQARTKGKDTRGVGYVKRNAIVGHSFASWAAQEAHLVWWMREIADERVDGTTGERPVQRFRREEASAPRPLDGRPPFRQVRDLARRVQSDCCIEVDTNAYSVPWRLIGETVARGGRRRADQHPSTEARRWRSILSAPAGGSG